MRSDSKGGEGGGLGDCWRGFGGNRLKMIDKFRQGGHLRIFNKNLLDLNRVKSGAYSWNRKSPRI